MMSNVVSLLVLLLSPIQISSMDLYALIESGRITEALDNQSHNDDELANIGNTCAELTKYDLALSFYDMAIQKSSSKKASHYKRRGECHLSMKNWDAAIEDYKSALRLESDESGQKGLKRATVSKRCYEVVDDTFSSDLSADELFELGSECQEVNALTEATRCYTAAIAKSPQKKFYLSRGECNEKLLNWGAAESDFRRVLEIEPGNRDIHRILSKPLFKMGKFDEAIKEMIRSGDYDGKNLVELGDNFAKTAKKFVEAFLCYKAALRRCPPGNAVLYAGRKNYCSQMIRTTQTPDRAVLDFKRILRFEPSNLLIRMHLLEALLETENFSEAAEVIKSLENTEILTVGYNLMAKKRFIEAVVCFTEFIERNSENPVPSSYTRRGFCYRHLGILDKAIADFHKTLELQPNNWSGHADLCEVLIEAKEINEARKVVQFAEENIPHYEIYLEIHDRIKKVKEELEQMP